MLVYRNGKTVDVAAEELAAMGLGQFEYVPTVDDVVAERSRRLALGFDYDFGDRGVHHIATTEQDLRNWDEVTKLAAAYIAAGQPAATIAIQPDAVAIEITAEEWQLVLIAAGAFRQPIFQASFALQAMAPIPADYADDRHWT